jgi:hypothetical protein
MAVVAGAAGDRLEAGFQSLHDLPELVKLGRRWCPARWRACVFGAGLAWRRAGCLRVPGVLASRAAVGNCCLAAANEGHAPSGGRVMRGGLDQVAESARVDDLAVGLAGYRGPAQQRADGHQEVDLRGERGAPAGLARSWRAERPWAAACPALIPVVAVARLAIVVVMVAPVTVPRAGFV